MHVGHTLLPRYICIARVEFLWCCNVSIYPTHTCTHAYNVQRLWLPRQAARQRSCCNLYAKLFYKLSKKDGVSRKHSRWHTHTNTHTHSNTQANKSLQSGANKRHVASATASASTTTPKRLQPQHLSMSSIRNSHRHSQSFCQTPCRCMNM